MNQFRTYPTASSSLELQSKFLRICDSGDLSAAFFFLNSTDRARLPPKPVIFASLLRASTRSFSFRLGLQIHTHIFKSGLQSDRFVGNSLLALYFKLCPSISVTRQVFGSLPVKDVVSWTSMVSGYVRAGKPIEALRMFISMSDFGVDPNAFTLSSAIKACAELENPDLGRCFHGKVMVIGFKSNRVISSSLVDLYGRSSFVDDARKVFDEMPDPDPICWTSLISALTRNDRFEEALGFFRSMLKKINEFIPDEFLLGTILSALGNLGKSRQGKEAHSKVITSSLSGNVVVESSLVDMYSKCGLVDLARQVFDRMPHRNAVSWCALLGGYCQSGNYNTVIDIFREMDLEDYDYCFGSVLRSCTSLSAVMLGKELHCYFLKTRSWKNVVVESALIDLYAKCGLVDYAHRVFVAASTRNLITWNAMICGFAQNGRADRALEVFDEMLKRGWRPDYVTFVAVLFACSHKGMVEEGKKSFRSMTKDYGIEPGIEHYSCMVDLLSRAGMLEEAETLILSSSHRDDSSLWAALLGACATHSSAELAERVAKKMIELEPRYHLSYILLANVYKSVGRWNDALEIRGLMRKRGARKEAGKSWIGSAYRKNSACSNSTDSFSIASSECEDFTAGRVAFS
ncbi:Pentatricopeptide repeat-containing protein [Apostasia shenzhenica]|uniref:Pentatricopeptide repeat-containing protein n=1 Tax=Apostasia shenzhenica TaxID=1088818 RepID=A0A2I0A9L6_9ASPA|nr:Pentatricopeptide repeat-containing protein [Apostasia shenzhenica]